MQIEIPGYSIVSTLNQDAAATVYLALDRHTRREVALKIMPLEARAMELPAQLLAHERLRMQRLVHPNIVKILDVGIHAGHYFLALEYLPGSTLSHKRFELDLLARLRVVIDIAKALKFIAAQGYAHGSLSPDNILIHAQDGRAILLGFGLSQMTAAKGGNFVQLPTASASATPADTCFQSPEQLLGKSADSRSDLYSLGVLLFLLLTDHLPFPSTATDDSYSRQTIPHLPEHLQSFQPIVNRLLNPQLAARYQRADECIADLGALPESAVHTAIEGFELSLVHESESPLQLMTRTAATADIIAPVSTTINEEVLLEPAEAFFIDNDIFHSQSDLGVDTTRILDDVRARPYEDLPLILIAAIGLIIPFAIYFAGQNSSPPTTGAMEVAGAAVIPAQAAVTDAVIPEKFVVVVEPDLAAQAVTLRAQLENNFALATDLVVIYRAALRGEDPREHAFAHAGIAELQQLFSERIHTHMAGKKLEAAEAERDLALWLFEPEELLPVLTEAFAAVK